MSLSPDEWTIASPCDGLLATPGYHMSFQTIHTWDSAGKPKLEWLAWVEGRKGIGRRKKMRLVVLVGEALVSGRDPAARHRDLEFPQSSICRENWDHIAKVTWSQPSTTKLLQGIGLAVQGLLFFLIKCPAPWFSSFLGWWHGPFLLTLFQSWALREQERVVIAESVVGLQFCSYLPGS